MALGFTFYRNRTSTDTESVSRTSTIMPTVEELGFTNPGYYFIQWNLASDGSGNFYYPGQDIGLLPSSDLYAIWGDTETTYTTTESEISSIADAIRTKGGTSAALTYPTGFISAINAISGGDTDIEDGLITRTISGAYENSRVDYIGPYAFYYCTSLTTVSFPTATTIGNYAFEYCSNLTTVNFPKVTTINPYAFESCINLTTTSFPSVTTIGGYAFEYCSNLTAVSFPSVTNIGSYAFYNCSNLTTTSFPNATTIGNYAFAYTSLTTITNFPKVTNIGGYAFYNCRKLTIASFSSVTTLGVYAFYYCTSLTTTSFPSVTTIGNYAFGSCSNLTAVSFPSVTTIGNNTFRSCFNLISLYLSGTSVVSLTGSSAFASTPIGGYSTSAGRYGSVYVPSSLLTSYKAATYWSLISSRIVGY